jgi:hypothetical protein
MSEQAIGQAAHRAVKFLRELHKDVHTVITTLDDLMEESEWYPSKDMGNRISDDLGNSLDNYYWVLENLTRIYVPDEARVKVVRAIIFSVAFAPAQFDESVCLIVVADFARPISIRQDFWNVWESWDRTLERLAGEQGSVVLTPQELADGFMPAASRGQAFIVPLTRLDSESALQQEVVKPALRLSARESH